MRMKNARQAIFAVFLAVLLLLGGLAYMPVHATVSYGLSAAHVVVQPLGCSSSAELLTLIDGDAQNIALTGDIEWGESGSLATARIVRREAVWLYDSIDIKRFGFHALPARTASPLPGAINIELVDIDGVEDAIPLADVPILWDTGNADLSQPGTYTVRGAPQLSELPGLTGIEPADITVRIVALGQPSLTGVHMEDSHIRLHYLQPIMDADEIRLYHSLDGGSWGRMDENSAQIGPDGSNLHGLSGGQTHYLRLEVIGGPLAGWSNILSFELEGGGDTDHTGQNGGAPGDTGQNGGAPGNTGQNPPPPVDVDPELPPETPFSITTNREKTRSGGGSSQRDSDIIRGSAADDTDHDTDDEPPPATLPPDLYDAEPQFAVAAPADEHAAAPSPTIEEKDTAPQEPDAAPAPQLVSVQMQPLDATENTSMNGPPPSSKLSLRLIVASAAVIASVGAGTLIFRFRGRRR